MYQIWAQYKNEMPEVLDTTDNVVERDSLIDDYRQTFGPEYTVYWTSKEE